MGGQACVLYGAAQVSRDVDFLLLAEEGNFERLHRALEALNARRVAVPAFSPEVLARGHAVHFRCMHPDIEGLRVDVMTRLRGVPDFPQLWERRTVIQHPSGEEFNLLSVPDLVAAKKTQRMKDWPMIEALVAVHYRENAKRPQRDWVEFWLREARTPELIVELVRHFPNESAFQSQHRPLLRLARSPDLEPLREALDAEVRAEQARDREYWAPLKAEIEAFRRVERERGEYIA